MFELKCPGCGSVLEMDLDKLLVYCPYCGNKLSVEMDVLRDILVEREKTRQVFEELRTKREISKDETERSANRWGVLLLIAISVFVILGNTIAKIFGG